MREKDIQRLRELAKHQLDLANSPKNLECVALWKRHNAFCGEKPPIHIETDSFFNECITPRLVCEDPFARQLEFELIQSFINHEEFDDDKPIAPYFQLPYDFWFHPFGYEIKEDVELRSDGTEMGRKLHSILEDLEDEADKLDRPSDYGIDVDGTLKKQERIQDIFGDILDVRLVWNSFYVAPTYHVLSLMGMENMLINMFDYPELFADVMDRLADHFIAHFKEMEQLGVLRQNHGFERLFQGSYCFWEEDEIEGPVRTNDMWLFMDSQETLGISPSMFHDLIMPSYRKIAEQFARLSYGCCEPVCRFWDDIRTLPNLKKVSVSAWCDENYMAEQLRGKPVIYHRKPDATFLGVEAPLDEEGFRQHIEKTIKTAHGCHLEITQRDVYLINKDVNRVHRYVQIIREAIDKYWQS